MRAFFTGISKALLTAQAKLRNVLRQEKLRKAYLAALGQFIHKKLSGGICISLSWASVKNCCFHIVPFCDFAYLAAVIKLQYDVVYKIFNKLIISQQNKFINILFRFSVENNLQL